LGKRGFMSKVVHIKKVIEGCGSGCPFYQDHDGGIMGPYKWCGKAEDQILKTGNKYFPKWCPLDENK